MEKYLNLMRKSKAKENAYVMAPGDREWKIAHDREKHGVVLDPVTSKQFKLLADRFEISSKYDLWDYHD